MAKRSIKVNPKSVADVPSGDVNITYNGTRIAGLSETTSATLETEETLVMHDIELEYTKPETPSTTHTVTLTRNGTPLSPAKSFTGNVGSYVGEANISLGSALETPACQCYLGDEVAYSSRAIPLKTMFSNSEGTVDLYFIMPDSAVFDRIDIEG